MAKKTVEIAKKNPSIYEIAQKSTESESDDPVERAMAKHPVFPVPHISKYLEAPVREEDQGKEGSDVTNKKDSTKTDKNNNNDSTTTVVTSCSKELKAFHAIALTAIKQIQEFQKKAKEEELNETEDAKKAEREKQEQILKDTSKARKANGKPELEEEDFEILRHVRKIMQDQFVPFEFIAKVLDGFYQIDDTTEQLSCYDFILDTKELSQAQILVQLCLSANEYRKPWVVNSIGEDACIDFEQNMGARFHLFTAKMNVVDECWPIVASLNAQHVLEIRNAADRLDRKKAKLEANKIKAKRPQKKKVGDKDKDEVNSNNPDDNNSDSSSDSDPIPPLWKRVILIPAVMLATFLGAYCAPNYSENPQMFYAYLAALVCLGTFIILKYVDDDTGDNFEEEEDDNYSILDKERQEAYDELPFKLTEKLKERRRARKVEEEGKKAEDKKDPSESLMKDGKKDADEGEKGAEEQEGTRQRGGNKKK